MTGREQEQDAKGSERGHLSNAGVGIITIGKLANYLSCLHAYLSLEVDNERINVGEANPSS
jgi:hypothetical protein